MESYYVPTGGFDPWIKLSCPWGRSWLGLVWGWKRLFGQCFSASERSSSAKEAGGGGRRLIRAPPWPEGTPSTRRSAGGRLGNVSLRVALQATRSARRTAAASLNGTCDCNLLLSFACGSFSNCLGRNHDNACIRWTSATSCRLGRGGGQPSTIVVQGGRRKGRKPAVTRVLPRTYTRYL